MYGLTLFVIIVRLAIRYEVALANSPGNHPRDSCTRLEGLPRCEIVLGCCVRLAWPRCDDVRLYPSLDVQLELTNRSYLSEIAMPQFRGILLCAFTLSLALGQFSNRSLQFRLLPDTNQLTGSVSPARL
jgi:hypothetical protein